MIDKTPFEEQALASALRPLGEAVSEIGMDKPLSAYTRDEVLTLIGIIVDAYQRHLLGRGLAVQGEPANHNDMNCLRPLKGESYNDDPTSRY